MSILDSPLGGYHQEQEFFAPEHTAMKPAGQFGVPEEPNEFTTLLFRDLTDDELMQGGAHSS